MPRKHWSDYPAILSTKQAAELLDASLSTILKYCQSGEFPASKIDNVSGEFPAIKMDNVWRIDRDELRQRFVTVFKRDTDLAYQLGEIELALSTLAAIHSETPVELHIRNAHKAALKAYYKAVKVAKLTLDEQ